MKKFLKQILHSIGYEIFPDQQGITGSDKRPIGNLKAFLEDIRSRGFSPNLVLDVGANRGDWTLMAKEVFQKASFLLIEPQAEMRKSLNEHRAIYHGG